LLQPIFIIIEENNCTKKIIGDCFFYFHFCTKKSFLRKTENKRYNHLNGLDLDKYYLRHDPEQHSYIQEVVIVGHLG